ncbi:MAG: hypothetical protein IPN34_01560 [Planctomycetes bacterium]|nr:hypothetical protein [Planctomycetota bacterium]
MSARVACRGALLFALLVASGVARAQVPFRVDARGPFRAGEWVALELDTSSVREVGEISVHLEGREEPWASFQRGPERSEPPSRFPLLLDERGRFEVRCDGRVVQRLALEIQPGTTWPARTWMPPRDFGAAAPAWWELAAFSAAYAPEPTSAAIQRVVERIARARRLPAEPLDLGAIRAAQLLRAPQLGHALGAALLALAVLGLAFRRRLRAALWIASGAGAIALQLAAPSSLWPGRERLIVWSATPLAGGAWELCADELRFGNGEVALDDELWLAPLAEGELVACRSTARGWVVSYRGGIARRWFAPPGALGEVSELAAGTRELLFYEGRRFRGRAPATALGSGGLLAHVGPPPRERVDLLSALAVSYAASGEREHAVWTSASARAAARRFERWWPWVLAAIEALARSGGASAGEAPSPRPAWSAWEELRVRPPDPFGATEAPRFLRLCEGG